MNPPNRQSSAVNRRQSIVSLKNPLGGRAVEVGAGDITLMGVINRSPESANRDVYADSPRAAVALASGFGEYGVEVIDVGGQSTNYENPRIAVAEEIERLIPTIEALATEGFVVSVDTFRADVAREAVAVGASLINDTAGLQDSEMVAVAAETGVPVVLMHLEAEQPLVVGSYDDNAGKPGRLAKLLDRQLDRLVGGGVTAVVVDPGTGISYRTDYGRYSQSQFEIAEHLQPLTTLGVPVMYAVPRKADRYRNVALAALAMASGAAMLRIHDVAMISDVAWMMRRLSNEPQGSES